jgi:hypothetical protein
MTKPTVYSIDPSPRKMNRLILVGNGFDLAHGMKTSYNHFILDYIISCFTSASNKEGKTYVDEAFEISTEGRFYQNWPTKGFDSIEEIITSLYNDGKIQDLFNKENFQKAGERQPLVNIFNVKVKMPFIEHLVRNCSQTNWVDIENEFYEKLKGILSNQVRNSKAHEPHIQELNKSLNWLIDKLQQYLTRIATTNNCNFAFEELIKATIDKEDFVDKEYYSSNNIDLGRTMVLNFNYTSTIEQYIDTGEASHKRIEINYIHGQLNSKKNPIIFGFGDELDENYLKLELDKAKGLFEYIKSFWYFKTSNYYNLIRFIDSSDFQVYVVGHSCGLSDRTMLNMIFENERCRSIKIFYHGTKEDNNYTALTQEISRHFKDKRLMRRRIVSLDRSSAMPQAT